MFNRCIVAVVFSWVAMGATVAQTPPPAAPRSAAELAARYRQAHDTKDIDAIAQLFFWGASTSKNRELVMSFIMQDVAHAIRGVSVKPIDSTDLTRYTQNGVSYQTTLAPTAKLVIDFLPREEGGRKYTSEQTSYFIGVRNGEYWLATAEPVKPPPPLTAGHSDQTASRNT
jgi:hypothetical protein